MDVIPYLLVNNAKNAILFYEEIFSAKLLEHRPFTREMGQSMNFPDNYKYSQSTMHAVLKIDDTTLYLADNNQQTQDYGHVELTLEIETEARLKKIYKYAETHQCEMKMPLTKMPGLIYARIVDPFGIGWQLNYIIPKK